MINLNFLSFLEFIDITNLSLISLFVISILAATVLPIGSEAILVGILKSSPSFFWISILVATLGNTIGGIISFKMGFYAKQIFAKDVQTIWFHRLKKNGPKTLLLAWLPIVGDSMCILAGWLNYSFWLSVLYMAIGKFLRYFMIAVFAINMFPAII